MIMGPWSADIVVDDYCRATRTRVGTVAVSSIKWLPLSVALATTRYHGKCSAPSTSVVARRPFADSNLFG
jgi:hypothetical protein